MITKIRRSLIPVTAGMAIAMSLPSPAEETKKPEPAKQESKGGTANGLLQKAMTTMAGLTSYHASGTFTAGKAKATFSGSFGVGVLDMQVKGFDGKTIWRRAMQEGFWLSKDEGKTWEADAERQTTIMLSSVATGPIAAGMKAWEQGEFKVIGKEKLGAEAVVHIQKPKAGKSAAMDFWLAEDAKLGTVVRKASLVMAADDGEFPVEITYTKLGEPVNVEAPGGAAEKEKPAKKE